MTHRLVIHYTVTPVVKRESIAKSHHRRGSNSEERFKIGTGQIVIIIHEGNILTSGCIKPEVSRITDSTLHGMQQSYVEIRRKCSEHIICHRKPWLTTTVKYQNNLIA